VRYEAVRPPRAAAPAAPPELGVALLGGRGLDLLLALEAVEHRQRDERRDVVRVAREAERVGAVAAADGVGDRLVGELVPRAVVEERQAVALVELLPVLTVGELERRALLPLRDGLVEVGQRLGEPADVPAQAQRREVLTLRRAHVELRGALAGAERVQRRAPLARLREQVGERGRQRREREPGGELRVKTGLDAHLLVEPQPLDLGLVLRLQPRDLGLADRHLGAADVEHRAHADLRARPRELELCARGHEERVLQAHARVLLSALMYCWVTLARRVAPALPMSASAACTPARARRGGSRPRRGCS
jgi:hypothetical protein